MPRGKSTNGPKNTLPKFVSCSLSGEELATVQDNILDASGICEFIRHAVEDSLKVSIGYDEYNDTCICTVTSRAGEKGDPALALSSRGPGVAECVSSAAYKLYQKLDGDLNNGGVEENKRSWS